MQACRIGIVVGQDLSVAAWTWQYFGLKPLFIDRAFGLLEDGRLVGSVIFREWNGANAEVSYYAKDAVTVGVVRCMVAFALEELGVQRLTFRVRRSDKRLRAHLVKFGATFECAMPEFYNDRVMPRDRAAAQYVMFRETLLKLAGPLYRRGKMH